jgi:hypothetical protein
MYLLQPNDLSMPDSFTAQEQAAIPVVLSRARFTTYLAEKQDNVLDALRLYQWNALISSSFLFPLHVFEIGIRNAAANAVEHYYNSPNWPWVAAFEASLPVPASRRAFAPRRALVGARLRNQTTGKLIADIQFAFWVSLYTSRHHGRLWAPSFAREYPHAGALGDANAGRQRIHKIANNARELRNRIAHHEPIFRRNLQDDYNALIEAIGYRCQHTAAWVQRAQTVTALLPLKP